MKKHLSTILLVFVFFVGLSVMLYPSISDYWNSLHHSRAIVDYDAVYQSMSDDDTEALFEAARQYNDRLREIPFPLMNHEQAEGYEELLNIGGTGIMGYLDIEKIGVELPIYHGTSDGVLNVAVGHVQGTSLPTGGENTHAVFSAHRGLPSAKLFSDLDKLEPGDTFVVTVLGRQMTYLVDQVLIVEPHEVEALDVTEGKDYCTLVTCTPYGINSHRILVRGVRTDNAPEARQTVVPADAHQLRPILVAPVLALPLLLVLLVVLMVEQRRKK